MTPTSNSWIEKNISWILIVCGALTCSMLLMAIAPHFAARLFFGEEITAVAGLLLARSWGAMVFAQGLLLAYTAWHGQGRAQILLFSMAGKSCFFGLVVADWAQFHDRPGMIMAFADFAMVLIFAWYLIDGKANTPPPERLR